MDKKMMWKLRWAGIKEYLPSFKKPFASRKGSPTMEYVTILAAGALLAMIVVSFFQESGDGSIANVIKTKISDTIKGESGGGDNEDPPK
ncbi:hypothetical protein GCM10007416_26310 [Kroppenstedtia guangzhouensis]|uniref:Uncharacterized protein n=1 Tax=Kroppenstedtia guangzhouensis TaxID=1274356 RepID=A0ABQ1GWS9_9BACL|nr:hypothetical protein [Kroppenstedtia guangzhouensis]GGA51948.1 hypothetical protein GCM10007416_26310 [Kroppenstedtia guangzhouensis]